MDINKKCLITYLQFVLFIGGCIVSYQLFQRQLMKLSPLNQFMNDNRKTTSPVTWNIIIQ